MGQKDADPELRLEATGGLAAQCVVPAFCSGVWLGVETNGLPE